MINIFYKSSSKKSKIKKRPISMRNQAGIGLVSAIFIITILALLAAGMASLVANSSKIHTQQILTIRAESAARSGLNIYLASSQSNNTCPEEQTVYTFENQGLYDCEAEIICTSTQRNEESFMLLTSKGSCGSDIDTANRVIEKYLLR